MSNYLIEVASATESFRTTLTADSPEDAEVLAAGICRLLGERPGGTWRVTSLRVIS